MTLDFPVHGIQKLAMTVSSLAEEIVYTHCPDRAGGYFVLAEPVRGIPIFGIFAGAFDVPFPKAEKYTICAHEKAIRLASCADDATSFASRNMSLEQYGGAIRARPHIYSFSGFSEEWDEALALLAAISSKELSLEEARAIACAATPLSVALANPHIASRLALAP